MGSILLSKENSSVSPGTGELVFVLTKDFLCLGTTFCLQIFEFTLFIIILNPKLLCSWKLGRPLQHRIPLLKRSNMNQSESAKGDRDKGLPSVKGEFNLYMFQLFCVLAGYTAFALARHMLSSLKLTDLMLRYKQTFKYYPSVIQRSMMQQFLYFPDNNSA